MIWILTFLGIGCIILIMKIMEFHLNELEETFKEEKNRP